MSRTPASDQASESDRAFHSRWLRTWERGRRFGWLLVAFTALTATFAFLWATLHLPDLWWLYVLVAIDAAAMLSLLRTIRSQTRNIARERDALDQLDSGDAILASIASSSAPMQVERRTFAPEDYDAERARAIRDAFRTGHIIVGRIRDVTNQDPFE